MGIASKFNSSNINWGVETKDAKYIKASELVLGKEYAFKGCFISKDNGYGEGAVIISEINKEITLVNAPQSFVATAKELRADSEAIDATKRGELAFKVESFTSKYKRTGYKITLVDIEPAELPFK